VGKDISRVEVSQEVGNRRPRRWESRDRVFEAKWSELGTRKQVGNCNREVSITMGAGKWEEIGEQVGMGKTGVSYSGTGEDDFNPVFRML